MRVHTIGDVAEAAAAEDVAVGGDGLAVVEHKQLAAVVALGELLNVAVDPSWQ